MFSEDGRSWRGGGGAGASERQNKGFQLKKCIYAFKKFQIIESKKRKLSK
jgi:hypothetical protein